MFVALLFGAVAVAVLGVVIAGIDTFRGTDDGPSANEPGVVEATSSNLDEPSDRANLFDMQFTVGGSGTDLGSDVDVLIGPRGPMFENNPGFLQVLMANTNSVEVTPMLTITAPPGITVQRVGGATCDGLGTAGPVACQLAIPAGGTIGPEVEFTIADPAIGRFVLDTNVAVDPLDVPIEPVPDMRYGAVGRGDILMIGNSVLSCDEAAPACAGARDGTGDAFSRRDLPAAFVGAASSFGLVNSSAATLDLDEAAVASALLFWSGDLSVGDTSISPDGPIDSVTVAPPNDRPVEVLEAAEVQMSATDPTKYIAYADVTDLVVQAGSGSYLVGNVQSVELGGSSAGWSLVVVTHDERKPLRELVVLSPFDLINGQVTAQSIIPSAAVSRAPTKLQLLTFDADRGSAGDMLTINGLTLGDGDGDLFSGVIMDSDRTPDHLDNFGTGISEYRFELNAPSELVAIETASSDDELHIGVISLVIDLE